MKNTASARYLSKFISKFAEDFILILIFFAPQTLPRSTLNTKSGGKGGEKKSFLRRPPRNIVRDLSRETLRDFLTS